MQPAVQWLPKALEEQPEAYLQRARAQNPQYGITRGRKQIVHSNRQRPEHCPPAYVVAGVPSFWSEQTFENTFEKEFQFTDIDCISRRKSRNNTPHNGPWRPQPPLLRTCSMSNLKIFTLWHTSPLFAPVCIRREFSSISQQKCNSLVRQNKVTGSRRRQHCKGNPSHYSHRRVSAGKCCQRWIYMQNTEDTPAGQKSKATASPEKRDTKKSKKTVSPLAHIWRLSRTKVKETVFSTQFRKVLQQAFQ